MKIIYTFFIVVFLFVISACQTIENKSQSAIKKENEKLSKFLQQPESELKIVMGEPDNIIKSDKGTIFLVYTKKKYNITCERKFEIDQNKMIVGFTSMGCFKIFKSKNLIFQRFLMQKHNLMQFLQLLNLCQFFQRDLLSFQFLKVKDYCLFYNLLILQ